MMDVINLSFNVNKNAIFVNLENVNFVIMVIILKMINV